MVGRGVEYALIVLKDVEISSEAGKEIEIPDSKTSKMF